MYGDKKKYNHTGGSFPPPYDGCVYTGRKPTTATHAEMQKGFIPDGVYLIEPDKNWRLKRLKEGETGNIYVRYYLCDVYRGGKRTDSFRFEEVADEYQLHANDLL